MNECPQCYGQGWIVKTINGRKFSVRCDCWAERRKIELLQNSKIPERYSECLLENFVEMNANLIKIKGMVDEFIETFPSNGRGLLIMGPPGVGKTHLSVGILKKLVETKGVSVLFYDFRELLQDLKNTFDERSRVHESDIHSHLRHTDVLLLDELGSQKLTEWTLDILMSIINYRYNNAKTVIITTNYLDVAVKNEETLEERIGSRLRSRLHEMCMKLEISAHDYRLKKQDFRDRLRSG